MEITPDLIMGYGLINKISTGHGLLDMLLCLLVPLLLKTAIPWLTDFVSNLFNKPEETKESFTRVIEFTKTNYWWYDDGSEPANSTLQRAILNQINQECMILRQLPNAEFQLRKKPQEKRVVKGDDKDDDGDDEQDEQHNYTVNHVPPLGIWVDLKNGIKFMRQQEEQEDKSGGSSRNKKITYFLESNQKDGNVKIDKFVEEALALYKAQQASKVDHARYLYVPVLTGWAARTADKGEGEGGAKASALYKRYKLSEERTFESLFHPDKAPILHLVNQFLHKQGKFGIPGYPQKLGFLLYGPPGTGKTSFIKALSQYTKRSVISIPLSKISTNQELMDIMFDQKISVEGQDSINLSHAKTIFVMEDVDAASHVVSRRSEANNRVEMVSAAALARMASARKEADANASDSKEIEAAEDKKSDDLEGEDSSKKKAKGFGPLPAFGKSWLNDDELNLAGLLNVLDGVVDTPNRIIIMTTNHPEKLDPALIRPGRINKKIYMGRIRLPEALSMMRHYFGDVSPQLEARLRVSFIDEALSPAEVEAMCADFDTAEDMVEQLEAKFGGRYIAAGTPYVKAF